MVLVWCSDGFGVISRTGEPSAIAPEDVAMLLEEGAHGRVSQNGVVEPSLYLFHSYSVLGKVVML